MVLLQCVPSDAASGKSDLSKDFVLLETESFSHKGGWVLDQQFMDQMGSPFLLAHGMGVPVENAETEIVLPKGKWTVYARTWNWCSPWGTKDAPGRFKLSVDGSELPNELGTGQAWGWEYAGEVEVTAKQKSCTVALRDLTGFEGRCDAILFSKAGKSAVPNEGQALHDFRMKLLGHPLKPADGGHYDMVVVGAGVAGICAALHSARSGMKVALIHDRPVPGGNNSVEVHVVASGALCAEPFPKLGEIVRDVRNVYDKQDKIINLLKSQENLTYLPNMHVTKASTAEGKIVSAVAANVVDGTEAEFFAPLFVDCTGDGNLGYLAGAEFREGRESRMETRETLAPDRVDNMTLGSTISWKSKAMPHEAPFPDCPWAIQFVEDSCEPGTSGSNWWESGFWDDQVGDAEYVRDYLFRAIFGNWAFLKNHSKNKKDYANRQLSWMTYILGKRETRRLIGDVFFTQQDIEGAYRQYDDAMIYGTYSIDQHFPTPKNTFYFPKHEFMSTMKHYFNDLGTPRRHLRDDQVPPPYFLPYRCLYSVNVENMFMAGRNVSVSHIAHSSTRVQNMTGMMGEVVGAAAVICKKYGCSPREVYKDHLEELLGTFR